MPSASAIRYQLETALSAKMPQALSPREKAELTRIPCGISTLDELLHGGLPVGVITELIGAMGSGRTTAALAYMAAGTMGGNVCAWIDGSDVFDPETAADNCVDLDRLLWVRCGAGNRPPSPHIPQTTSVLSTASALLQRHSGGGSPHPRSEGRDMPQAISAMLEAHGGLYDHSVRRNRRFIGTPGAPNRQLSQKSSHREEQVNSDRMPPRRGDNLAIVTRCADPQLCREASLPSGGRLSGRNSPHSPQLAAISPWQAIDQALRATDLLLQTGGFSVIVLDLGSIAPEFAWRIPLATWFRFRAACERTRVSLILLTQHVCTRSAAELVVRLQPGQLEAQSKVMTGIRYRATTERNRSQEATARLIPIRKLPQSERPGEWFSTTAWARGQ